MKKAGCRLFLDKPNVKSGQMILDFPKSENAAVLLMAQPCSTHGLFKNSFETARD
jgi:hypothetical protein